MIKKGLITVVMALVLMVGGCSSRPTDQEATAKTIVVDLYPIEFLTKAIVGDKLPVVNMIRYGIEPHDFELSLTERKIIEEGGGFIRIGAGMDHWADKLPTKSTLDLSKVVILREHTGEHKHEHEGGYDPHYWNDFGNLILMAKAIGVYVAQRDPAHADLYRGHTTALVERIEALDARYKAELKQCAQKTIVVTHDAYEYLAGRYGIKTVSVLGIEPDEEPSLAKMNEIKQTITHEGLKILFLERIVSSKVPQTIAEQTGAAVKPLYSLENLDADDVHKGMDLISMAEANLQELKTALECRP